MLQVDRTPRLSPEAATELRDALGRRQKELPPRWLAAFDATTLVGRADSPTGHSRQTIERELGLALLRDRLSEARPRGLVCLHPSASAANSALVECLCARGSVTAIVTTEIDTTLATAMLARLTPQSARQSSAAIRCDCSVELPLPVRFPRPRVYLALGNVVGSASAVGAVRMLRVIRTTMTPGDSIVVGLDARRDATTSSSDADEPETAATRHFGALELVNAATGACFDPGRFDFRATFDAENCRLETHLVARKAMHIVVPDLCDVQLRKGESIRTSVRCTFERGRVSAMMAGVGLALREWTTDPEARFVVALASPAV